MSIAKTVYEKFTQTGKLVIPDGHKGAAVSLPQSSDPADQRRTLHIIFEDGSDLGIEIGGATLSWSEAGDISMESLDALLAARRS